jgi:hypothetical protein
MPSGRDERPRAHVRAVPAARRRTCARPSCATPAEATLAFVYDQRVAMLAPLATEDVPQAYDLCALHASRTQAPRGWTLDDRRATDEVAVTVSSPMPADLGGDRTVAVLAAALRAVPDPVSEDAVGPAAEVGRAPAAPIAPAASVATRPALALRTRRDGA